MTLFYLDVPFREKDQVKALGARWDPAVKKWYVPEGKDPAAFELWHSQSGSLELASAHSLPVSRPTAAALPQERSGLPCTLSQLLNNVAHAVSQAFESGVWTTAEVVQVHMRNGHVYLELSERSEQGAVLATARATLWASTAQRILPAFEQATGAALAPGLKLLMRAKPVFKPQYGFSLDVTEIDPDYTLGELEARKRDIRARLMREGLWGANRALTPAWDYQSVLVIAPEHAAGLGDFKAEASRLEHYGVCRFTYAYSRFQGEGAAAEIRSVLLAALAQCDGLPDAVAIIRGGGAVNDLAWLNDYELTRAVCTLSIPVLTGIGHERDTTLLDEVANHAFDTPSKVIAGIEHTIRSRAEQAKACFAHVRQQALRTVAQAGQRLEAQQVRVQTAARQQIAKARQSSLHAWHDVRAHALSTVRQADQQSVRAITDIRHTAARSVALVRQAVPAVFAEVHTEAQACLALAKTLSLGRMSSIQDRAQLDVARAHAMADQHVQQVIGLSHRSVADARTAVTALFREIAGQGPEKTLGRGFAMVTCADGKALTSAAQVVPDTPITISFHDGRVPARAWPAVD